MSNKIGFWSVFELVTMSQIGSGLVLPATLAFYGSLTFVGWIISSLGALALAITFSALSVQFPRKGGPHVYVYEAFGPTPAFFTGWTYWLISWISTIAIISSAIGYLSPFIKTQSTLVTLSLEILLVILVFAHNLKGIAVISHRFRCFLLILKIIPLILIPLAALFLFNKDNLAPDSTLIHTTPRQLNQVVILTFWGFIGFETITTIANEIKNPTKTIPFALIMGTLFVCITYFVSSVGILGVMPYEVLSQSLAPYADVARIMFGDYGYFLISAIAAIVCISAIHSWTLTSGQIALGITQDGLMPASFAQTNKNNVPLVPLFINGIASILFLVLTHQETMIDKINMIIELSVVCFLFVYAICCLSYLKIIKRNAKKISFNQCSCVLISFIFCLWIIFSISLVTLFFASFFIMSGLPIYLFRRKKFKQPVLRAQVI